jgi:lipopolysaccharide exporter
LFSGSLIAQAIGFAALYFLGRMYSPEAFGELEIFLKIAGVLIVVSGLRYEMSTVVEDDEEVAKNLTKLSLLLNAGISFIVLIIILFARTSIANFFNLSNSSVLYFVPLIIWLTGSTETLILWRNRQKEYAKISTNRVLSSSTGTAYKLSHFFLKIFSFNGLIIGHLLGQIIAFCHLLYKLPFSLFKLDFQAIKKAANKYRTFPLYSTPAALLNILATSMPVFLIAYFDGQESTGYFANAYKLTYLPMSMLSMSLGQVFFERIARLRSDSKEAAGLSHNLINLMFVLGIVPVVILAVWGDQIAPIILGPNWTEAGIYIQITILFYFSMFLTSAFSSAFETYGKLNIQLGYNLIFLIATFLAMFLTYKNGGSTRDALLWFVIIGVTLRVLVINYFFHLFGKNIILKTIFAIALVGLLTWLGLGIKHGF